MDRKRGALRAALLLGALFTSSQALAQYEVTVGIKQTEGRWQDTLLAGESHVLTVSITNPVDVAAYVLPFAVSSETNGAFAQLDGGGNAAVTYVNRLSTPGNPFTIREVNVNGVDGTDADSILFGAAEFGSNFLGPGTGIVIEYPLTVDPFVGNVRIDTAFLPPSNQLSFSLPNGDEITAVDFNALPVFPVVLRVPNDGPTCGTPSDITAPFGTPLAATITGNDTEGDALTFNQVSGPGSTTPAGDWSWTPGCPDVGSYEVCVTVSDPNHLDWDTCCFMVTVTQSAPTLNCTAQTVHYADILQFTVDATDDGCPQALTYFKTSGPGNLNPATGLYTYAPTCGDVGLQLVDIGVTDGQDTLTCQFSVTVTNNPPVVNCPSNFSAGVGDTVDFALSVSDPDGDSLTCTLLSFTKLSGPTGGGPNFPATLSADCQFNWPTTDVNDDDFGVWEVQLRVDEACDSAFCTFEIEITPNRSPVCIPPNDRSVLWSEGPASAQFVFSDPDGDPVTFSQVSGPGSTNASGLWTWSGFGCAERGTYEVCGVVADSAFPQGDTCCFFITILQNPPPLNCRDTSIHAGFGTLSMDFATTDDGCPGNPPRYFMVSGPGEIDSVSGLYTLASLGPNFGCSDIGTEDVSIRVTDGERDDTCAFTVSITNTPPVFECPIQDDTLEHTSDRPFVYASNPVDPDGDDLDTVFIRSFVKTAGPAGGPNNAPTIDQSGLVTWVTDSSNANDLGTWQMVLEARDTCDVSRCTLLVRVVHNRPPICLSGNTAGHQGDTAFGAVLGIDPDGDSLSFTQLSGPGGFFVAEDAARWSWLTTCTDVGTYEVCFTVSDPVFADADTCCFMVTIFETPPAVFCSTQTVHYGDTLIYDVPFDDDGCPQVATWSLLSGPGTLDGVTGQYVYGTACGDVGTQSVTVALFDGNRADTCTFDVNVTNTPPFVTCPPNQLGLKVGVTVNLNIPFGDVDGDVTAISLVSFQKLGGANANPPNNAPVLDAAGNFTWVTDFNNLDDVATWEVTVRVDEPCDSTLCMFRIEILPNEAPVCTSPADFQGVCDNLNTAAFEASDVEGDSVVFTQIAGPGSTNPLTGQWSWLPPCDSGGVYEVCVTVGDFLHPDADTCCFMFSICAVSEPGDVNGNGLANSEDIILMVNFMFKSGDMPFGDYTADMNCDGIPNSSDIITLVNYVFKGGPPPCDVCTSPLFPGLGP